MEVVITSLDALIHRATNASLDRPDPAALEAFCSVLADSPNGSYIATRVIASRIRSPHPTEALLALEVLDACMKRCDVSFHAEVDKFRFLNEMIKLVSPKYYGNKTAPAVRQKVLNLMHSWTIDYPREIKIRDAYEMLKKQGVVKDIPPPPPPEDVPSTIAKPRNKDVIFEDEEKSRMLQKLLQSKNPDDLQAANRLIKTMVREDERRVEAVSKRLSELQTVHNNAQLLDEMLDQYRPGYSSVEDLDLIKELHGACSRLRPTVFKLAAETQHNENMLNEVLEASDELGLVFDKYTAIVLQGKSLETVQNTAKAKGQPGSILLNGDGNSLLDFAASSYSNETNLMTATVQKNSNSNMEALGDIFSSVDISKNVDSLSQVHDVPILKPVSLVSTLPDKDTSLQQKQTSSQGASRGLAELDALGEGLIKQSLPPSVRAGVQFNSKSLDKVPMNLLGKTLSPVESILDELKMNSENRNAVQENHENMLDLDYLISKTLKSEGKETAQNSSNDDIMVDISTDDVLLETKTSKVLQEESDISLMEYLQDLKKNAEREIISLPSHSKQSTEKQPDEIPHELKKVPNMPKSDNFSMTKIETVKSPGKGIDVKPLTDINISLSSIKPGTKPPITVFDEESGLTVVLHFAENKPRPDVSVVVVSTTSRNTQPIEDFKFHAVVPKGCKSRMLSPSGDSFPAFSPFLPPAAVTQVLLIARPSSDYLQKIFLKFVITYTCQDDSISEMGEVESLPLDNI